ncbi:MAG: thiol-disulfide isomerase [Acidobacteria bacterium]|nr:MAG: thiol-disulfide isomerase [Acidobacteriota bacterium]
MTKKIGAVFVLISMVLAPAFSKETTWLTNFEKAKKLARKSGKPILMNFSGSDWCGYCIRLEKEVFSKWQFKNFAKDNLILLTLDFPRSKKQKANVKAQNKRLVKKYRIKGFPTVLLVDAKGNVILRTGYKTGGTNKYIEHLKAAISKAG